MGHAWWPLLLPSEIVIPYQTGPYIGCKNRKRRVAMSGLETSLPFNNLKFRRVNRIVRRKIVIVYKIGGRQLIAFQMFETVEKHRNSDVNFTICKSSGPLAVSERHVNTQQKLTACRHRFYCPCQKAQRPSPFFAAQRDWHSPIFRD